MASNDNGLNGNVNSENKANEINHGTDVDNDKNEDDLSDLLDSALDDFDKYSHQNKDTKKTVSENVKIENIPLNSAGNTVSAEVLQDPAFNQIFEELFKQFNVNHNTDASGNPHEELAAGDVNETLQKALGSLNQNLQNLQNENISESEMKDLLSKLNSVGIDDAGSNGGDDIYPMMQNMMKSLLSKELLYPSLKTISAQYPSWLSANENKLSPDDFRRYKEQYRIMNEIVLEYETERSDDSDEVKSKRVNKVLDMMQHMQSLGNPPQEIIGEMPKDLEYDELGLPKIPGLLPDPNQCLMS